MSRAAAGYLSTRWRFLLAQFVKRIWFRASLFSFGAIAIALFGTLLPSVYHLPLEIELAAGSVNSILTILASSMLAVTTFSLSIMVSAYAAAANNSTPRATSLLIEDSVASNTLATFVGSFLFSIVGIVGLSAQLYGREGRLLLFFSTLVVLFLVTAALLRWIEQLTRFGRVADTIRRVEQAASRAAGHWARQPRLGAMPAPESYPEEAVSLYREAGGYVRHVDMEALDGLARQVETSVHVLMMPGDFVSPDTALALVETEPDSHVRHEMERCFSIGPDRSYNQDPTFGLVVLSEIASRALSPAVNDPGTAIQVLGAGVRVFQNYCDGLDEERQAMFESVTAPDMPYGEMLEDFFGPIARDGAGLLEVQTRLQRCLEMIALANRTHFGEPAKRLAAIALKRALEKLDSPLEEARLKRSFGWELPDPVTGRREGDGEGGQR
ncbi:hypothetical protein B5C34_05475 [Pacificimonas flava]|uniref:DUF2254 domain-containing protein n=2 Tax=Pacificimonas TaxID=1960290 RepID=A0A219B497_9SPHN|nr:MULTISPECIES: DUF2254 domain-containing protein [Pacificimonas]MBZ6377329.1 DUF2254 domain-containing protein [Pacificimonas aurantium]OWV32963.1 hypothetical protein B5C34_05475 [Pacificimonas flava]